MAESVAPLIEGLFSLSNPIPLKWLLNRLGWQVGSVRLPLTMPDDRVMAPLWSHYAALHQQSAAAGA
jgi:dihydrodipicolinate synthase/N-acetylneuraminate lyase